MKLPSENPLAKRCDLSPNEIFNTLLTNFSLLLRSQEKHAINEKKCEKNDYFYGKK